LRPSKAATRRWRSTLDRSASSRYVMPGMSTGFARVSTTPERSPESIRVPSASRTGRRLKKVYGCAFWTNTLTPVTSVPPISAMTIGGFTT
jgi:hypothetical protein